MKKEFEINETTRIIGELESVLIATNDANTTLDDLLDLGVMINTNGEILSPMLPIGTLTKVDPFIPVNYYFLEKKVRK